MNGGEHEVVLFADTFNRYFERENLDAAYKVLTAAGYKVHCVKPSDGSKRPLCCGRTFFSVGKVEEARKEADLVLAFGAATFPHQLVRILLAEQIYRAITILAGHPYNRA